VPAGRGPAAGHAEEKRMKLIKYALLIALIVTAIQVMFYGLTGAYNGLFVKLGWVAPGPVVTLRDRVTRSMDRTRSDIQGESDRADQASKTHGGSNP
jgi:hypothetical protein